MAQTPVDEFLSLLSLLLPSLSSLPLPLPLTLSASEPGAAPASEKSDDGAETPLGGEGMCEEQSDSLRAPTQIDAEIPACAESSMPRPLQGTAMPSAGHHGLGRGRESSQGKEVVPLGQMLPQERGVRAVVLLPRDAEWESLECHESHI